MDVLSSRILLRPTDLARSHRFYRDELGLAVMREFGEGEHPGLVFFLGNGLLEVSGSGGPGSREGLALWIQVRDVRAEITRLVVLGHAIIRPPEVEPWGLVEAWIADPDGVPIVLVQIPDDHPLRRDQRSI
ncbi:VOC family protein [Herbiconiux sp.]|uniref:VOC family protein n=1 Tax=Herbiconiux sp. TaxID=1871186 RepID=UPI0025C00015|nr:VOC family protein [Herbiconiux sp.]